MCLTGMQLAKVVCIFVFVCNTVESCCEDIQQRLAVVVEIKKHLGKCFMSDTLCWKYLFVLWYHYYYYFDEQLLWMKTIN